MVETRKVTWTLWVFAGPGALPAARGQLLPLDTFLGALPPGVGLLAETVGTPTLVQRLTGEWPAERRAYGLDEVGELPPAERDLWRFVEWAERVTPKDSKRALIVLGDVLHATGQVPKEVVHGVYRPPYPSQIIIKRQGAAEEETCSPETTPITGSTQYLNQDTRTSKNTAGWLNSLNTNDSVRFGDSVTWTRVASGRYQKSGDASTSYALNPTSSRVDVFHVCKENYPESFSITRSGETTTYSKTSGSSSTYAKGDSKGLMGDLIEDDDAGPKTVGDNVSFGEASYKLSNTESNPRRYTRERAIVFQPAITGAFTTSYPRTFSITKGRTLTNYVLSPSVVSPTSSSKFAASGDDTKTDTMSGWVSQEVAAVGDSVAFEGISYTLSDTTARTYETVCILEFGDNIEVGALTNA